MLVVLSVFLHTRGGGGKDSKLINMSGTKRKCKENKQMFEQNVTNIQ